ncbi:VPS10 domain-containing protein [Croceitalea rosinachiae]|uniref:Sortilin N-terminal domain-containing protein n=1 Tax=Croceitalea rosinachiae TaxID=3075596 RepID=A0ABU3ADL9_9FLAO|nr:hypothetical protein [Croceitalea sp. F388]MDT0607607.1 hypothetical protein [Croceitalea sp. F388]
MKYTTFIISVLFVLVFGQVNGQTNHLDNFKNLKIRSVGPANMSGRITAIDVVHSDQNTMYVGAASGGVWKSENGGTRWEPIFDDNPTQNIGAIAIQQDQPNVLWVGTGEGNPRNSMNLGMGIFKSIDAGKTWKHMGLEATKTIHRIIAHPKDSNTVFVGAMGDTFTPTEERGLYRTKDGGKSWEKILYTNTTSGVADMVMDPENPNKLLVALYDHQRTPFSFVSGGVGSGLYMTLDGGDNWKRLTSENGLPQNELGRIGLAIAPSDSNRIYAKVEASKNALYRSDDGGDSWKMINNNPKFTNNRPFYFQELAVSSDDPNLLYNIYQPLSVSYDGGISFDPTPQIPADETKGIHADFHAFWMSPDDADFYIIGGDGGIGITRDKGESWYFPETIPVAQFYQINVDEGIPYNVYGGMQDNGNWYGPGYVWRRGGIRTLYWQYLVGGDGFYISPDLQDKRFGYGTSQNGSLYRYDKIGGYYSSIKPPTPKGFPRLRFHWNAAFAQDPHDPGAVYYGSQFVHRSKDKGKTWEVTSPDLTTNIAVQQKRDYGGLTLDASGAEFYNTILSIAPSPLSKDVIWAGTDDGHIQLTQDGGKTWNEVGKNNINMPKGAWVARIHASRHSVGSAWAVVNNYRKGDYTPYLFKTDDYGKSWKSIVNKDAPVFGYTLSFIQDPVEKNLVFLGTENGLWVSFNEGQVWEQIKNGFPSVSTMDLKIQERESALIIGTFGRAIWIIDDLQAMRTYAKSGIDQTLVVPKVNPVVQVKGLFINAPGNIWTGFHTTFEGDNRAFKQVDIPYFVQSSKPNQRLNIRILNAEGDEINSFKADTMAIDGLNYIRWGLEEKIAGEEGIAVLPGTYSAELKYGEAMAKTVIKVIPDPRFDFDPKIDIALYEAQKEIEQLNACLQQQLKILKNQQGVLQTLMESLSETDETVWMEEIKALSKEIDLLRYQVLGTPEPRQVGAWQSFEVTAISKLKEARRKFQSSHQMPSAQELELIDEARTLVNAFGDLFEDYLKATWKPFEAKIEERKTERKD